MPARLCEIIPRVCFFDFRRCLCRGFGSEHFLDGKNVWQFLHLSLTNRAQIDLKRAIPREEHLRNTRYFVGGLLPTTTSDSMRRFFSAYSKVVMQP